MVCIDVIVTSATFQGGGAMNLDIINITDECQKRIKLSFSYLLLQDVSMRTAALPSLLKLIHGRSVRVMKF